MNNSSEGSLKQAVSNAAQTKKQDADTLSLTPPGNIPRRSERLSNKKRNTQPMGDFEMDSEQELIYVSSNDVTPLKEDQKERILIDSQLIWKEYGDYRITG